MSKPRILIYGDSNTFGYDPENPYCQHPEECIWPTIFKKEIGEDYDIINDGLCGRVIGEKDALIDGRLNGSTDILNSLVKNDPCNILMIMLGTNDILAGYKTPMILQGLEHLVLNALQFIKSNDIILIQPPEIIYENLEFKIKPLNLNPIFFHIAEKFKTHFINASEFLHFPSGEDGIHFTRKDHFLFGNELAKRTRQFLA